MNEVEPVESDQISTSLEKRIKSQGYSQNIIDELSDTDVLLENVLEGSLAGYWIWDMENDYLYLSPTFKQMFGYGDHELSDGDPSNWQRLMHSQDVPGAFMRFDKHVESNGKIPYENEVRYYHKDGSIVWVYCKGRVTKWNEEGRPKTVVGCHVDITDLKKAQKAQKLAEEMEMKMKELEQFAFVASHDLQSPLNMISGFVELLYSEYMSELDDNAKMYLDNIQGGVIQMSDIIKKLLDYSRLGKEIVMTDVDCQKLMEKISRNHISTKISFDNLPVVKGYELELELLFQNLVSNAIKYSKTGIQPEIAVKSEKKENFWLFAISDNGIGIEASYHKKIFQIFQRLHPRHEYEGSGIGLAQCHKIVTELHKGNIWVESEPGVGSTFYFTLPC